MLVKMGVDYSRLKLPIRRSLNIVDEIYKKIMDEEAVLASTFEGNHMPGSLHYADLAADFRLKFYTMDIRDDIRVAVKRALTDRYGKFKYDVLFSAADTALHVEYDPK